MYALFHVWQKLFNDIHFGNIEKFYIWIEVATRLSDSVVECTKMQYKKRTAEYLSGTGCNMLPCSDSTLPQHLFLAIYEVTEYHCDTSSL